MRKEYQQLIAVLIGIGGIVYAGVVIAKMWQWFIVPLGVPQITIGHAIGFDVLITLIVAPYRPKSEKPIDDAIGFLIKTTVFLVMAWAVSSFVQVTL